mmetsp:Transcript_6698/g.9568  ORF Transcript_6698/g.9568 Transcript_6698/m.9568 type:complete len:498 (+) Transcript_6698:128-1621(+)
MSSSKPLPSQLVIAAGTYDGILAGWELTHNKPSKKAGKQQKSSGRSSSSLELTFATPVHEGSLRCLSLASSTEIGEPGSLLSCGYDEMLRTHDWHKHKTSIGEVRTPADFGTPTASSFAPPPPSTSPSTHCVVGFSNGKIVLYKKRDWSVQHVLAGHEGGVGSLSVHPTGKMALSGGQTDGKLKLWDLTKGRLAYVVKIPPRTTNRQTGKSIFDPVCSLVWSQEGNAYAFCHGSHITVRDVSSGKELLDVDLPSRANQVTLMTSSEETSPYYGDLFVAVACNDGSLPVLAVQNVDTDEDEEEDMTRRAILAIEPVDSIVAGEERFKCIASIRDFCVATANSAGVVSIMNLEGAVRMIMDPSQSSADNEDDEDDSEIESDDDDDEDAEEELAVDILQSTRLGSGARITSMTVWCNDIDKNDDVLDEDIGRSADNLTEEDVEEREDKGKGTKRKVEEIEVNADAVEKARELVSQAKKLKKKKEKKKKSKNKNKNKKDGQ